MKLVRESFTPEEIVIPDRLRTLDMDAVGRLADSIAKIGLRTPITVRWVKTEDDASIVLVAGQHRLEACKRLGWPLVLCEIFEGFETDARLWEIAENLDRAELTRLQRAEHIAEWVRLTEEQSAQVAPKGPVGHRPQGGINAAVRDLGIDRTEAQRSVKVAALPEEAKKAAREFGLDSNQSALLAAAKAAPEQAATVIREIAERKAVKPAPAPLNDIETEEQWQGGMMRLWNRAPDEWRENFLDRVQRPVFDNTRAA